MCLDLGFSITYPSRYDINGALVVIPIGLSCVRELVISVASNFSLAPYFELVIITSHTAAFQIFL